MEIRLLDHDKKEGKLRFILKDGGVVIANTLRRAINDEVPTMAIEDIEFRKNTGILYDEMVAHRLGLIPLTTDLKSYNLPAECKCGGKGCARCQLTLTLKAKGPGTVYSSELNSKDSAIKPVYKNIPIVKLLKAQTLELEATAMLGQGKIHTKWKPAHVYYRYKPVIEIGNVKNPEEVVEKTPGNIFQIKNNKLEADKDGLFNHDLAGAAEEISEGEIKETHDNDIIFTIESFGQLDPKSIVVEAISQINKQLDNFESLIKESLS